MLQTSQTGLQLLELIFRDYDASRSDASLLLWAWAITFTGGKRGSVRCGANPPAPLGQPSASGSFGSFGASGQRRPRHHQGRPRLPDRQRERHRERQRQQRERHRERQRQQEPQQT